MPFSTDRRRFLGAGIAVATGSTMAIGYLWLRNDTAAPAGTVEVVRSPTPKTSPLPPVVPSTLPTPGVDTDIEDRLARSGDDDRERSQQRMEERRPVAAVAPTMSMADTNTIDIAPQLGWRP